MPSSSRLLGATLCLAALAAPARSQWRAPSGDTRLGDRVRVSPSPLEEFDYQVQLTDRAINRVFASFTEYQKARRAARPGADAATLRRFEGRVVGGKLEISGEADAPVVGLVRFRLLGVLQLGEPDRFDYVLDDVEVTSSNTLKSLSLKLTKQVLMTIFGIFVNAGKLDQFVEISTNWAFNVPIVGPLLGDRTIFVKLKPRALPILDHFHTVHLSRREDGRITLQGLLRTQPGR